MRKITSTIIGLAIATILTASALTLSNQAFAQCNGTECGKPNPWGGLVGQVLGGHSLGDESKNFQLGVTTPSHVPHVGQALGGLTTTIHNILKGGSPNGQSPFNAIDSNGHAIDPDTTIITAHNPQPIKPQEINHFWQITLDAPGDASRRAKRNE